MKTSGNLLIAVVLFLFCCDRKEKIGLTEDHFVVTDVNVLDISNGSFRKCHVIVYEDKFEEIKDIDKTYDWGDAVLINGNGGYMIPGLSEMHAHVPPLEWDDPLMKETLFLYLSNGVTNIRGMLGHPAHLRLREKVEAREVLSPRFYTSSPSLNGNTVRTPEEAEEKVRAYAEAGYDFLKLHPGIRRHVFDQIVETANEVGIPYAGHVSNLVRIRHALENRYQTIDHVDGFLEGLVPSEEEVNPIENGFFGYNFTDLAVPGNIQELVAMSKENRVWVVPTQALFDRWFSPTPAEDLAAENEMKYISPETRDNWINSKNTLTGSDEYDEKKWERFNQLRYKLIKALHENGQGLLLGSDAPQVFNVPGFSIHHELQGMLDAGLSPLEALQIGSLNPARFYEGNFGEIKEGLDADFILVKNDPLEDINNLREIAGVMARGNWLSEDFIREELEKIAVKYK